MKKAALVLIGIALLASQVNAAVTLKDYRAARATGGHQWVLMRTYLNGYFNGLGFANAEYKSQHMPQLFCQPDKLKMTDENLSNIIEDAVARSNPPFGVEDIVEVILLRGLQYTFPC